jgi:hypothetical protein
MDDGGDLCWVWVGGKPGAELEMFGQNGRSTPRSALPFLA